MQKLNKNWSFINFNLFSLQFSQYLNLIHLFFSQIKIISGLYFFTYSTEIPQ